MIEEIRKTLAEMAQKTYGDVRRYHCRLQVGTQGASGYGLSGSVLDEETLTAVTAHLATQFPHATFDTGSVTVLRQPHPTMLVVATNLTGLYKEPSFLAERMSQVLNGQALELLKEAEKWAYVRQTDGYLGWVYRPYLAPLPQDRAVTHLVCAPTAVLRSQPEATATPVSRVLGGTVVEIAAAAQRWVQLSLAGDLSGWLPVDAVRACHALPAEEGARRAQIVTDAYQFTGVPYLWGGGSALGLDCSGFAQLLHRLSGVTIPRDADMQYEAGQVVEPPFQAGDLLFFGSPQGHRAISHVGVSVGGWHIVHASRSRNGVYCDDVQAVDFLRDIYLGARTFLSAPRAD